MSYYTDVYMGINCISKDKDLSNDTRKKIMSLIKSQVPNNIQLAIKLMGDDGCNCTKAIKLIIENVIDGHCFFDFYDDYLYLEYQSIKLRNWNTFPAVEALLCEGSDEDYAIITLGENYDDELILGSPDLFNLRLSKSVTHYN